MEYANPLGEEKISKLLIKYSVPAIVGMVVNSLYNVVDRIFIGNCPDLGSNGLAGITVGFPIMIILMSMGNLFGVGGATLFSIRLGENKKREAQDALGNAFAMLIISGLVFMVLGQIFLEPILSLFGTSETVLPYSVEYMRIIFFGAVFQVVSMGMNNFIRADGNPNIAMLTMFMGAGINIVLDPIFIFVFKMGMTGAALATILAQLISATWVVSYFLGKRCNHRLELKYMNLKASIIARITLMGLPGFSISLANSLMNAILNKSLLVYGGDIAISGMGILNSLRTMLLMPLMGIRQGMQPIISFNYGARKYKRVKKAAYLAIVAATAIVFMGYATIRLFPVQLISLFNREAELVEFTRYALVTWFLCLPVLGFFIIGSNFFQAIGRPKSAMFLTLTRQMVLLIPAIVVFPKYWGITGLLYATPFADFFSALLTGVLFYNGIRNLEKEATERAPKALATESK
ncbi:MAG: MATE family efflux transporter [Clostridiales bacterium]|jgi:putative MATE family efflux protein|nr:MATE family efflux transporter [Clostridiales bacterium]